MTGKNDLPSGWSETTLGEVVDILDSQRVPVNRTERDKRVGNIPYYGATGQVGWIDDHLFDEELVLLGEDGAPFLDHDKPIAYMIRGKSWVNNHAHVLRGRSGIINSFLLHQFNQCDFHPFVSGTTRLKLPQGPMRQIPLRICPTNEQVHIVDAIEEQFTRLDSGVAALKRVEANLKRYKAAVLKAACEGKLTEKWRQDHPDVEPASELLKRILKERRRRWEEAELAKMLAKGKPPKDDKWKEKYKEPERLDTRNLPEPPNGWAYCNLEAIASPYDHAIKRGPFGSTIKKEFFVPTGYAVYEQQHAIYGDFEQIRYNIDEAKFRELEAFQVKSGDLLISCSGTVGRTSIVPENAEPGVINQALLKLTLNKRIIVTRFFELLFAKKLDTLLRTNVRGSAMLNITGVQDLKRIPWALPPLDEQKAIMQEADKFFSVCDKLTTELDRMTGRASSLRQSILRHAFEGKLVDQDPSDEPAAKLLGRRAEQGKDGSRINSKPKRRKRVGIRPKSAGRRKSKARADRPELF